LGFSNIQCYFESSDVFGSHLLDPPKLRVRHVVVALGLLAREGVQLVGAGERVLAEHSLVAAEEREVGGLHQVSEVVQDGPAHVEDLALVGDVCVVTV